MENIKIYKDLNELEQAYIQGNIQLDHLIFERKISGFVCMDLPLSL